MILSCKFSKFSTILRQSPPPPFWNLEKPSPAHYNILCSINTLPDTVLQFPTPQETPPPDSLLALWWQGLFLEKRKHKKTKKARPQGSLQYQLSTLPKRRGFDLSGQSMSKQSNHCYHLSDCPEN